MIAIKDKSEEVWGWYDINQKGMIRYEDGTTKKITSKDVIFTSGKYAGTLLSDLSDVWYLNFMKKQAVDNSDWFMEQCAKLRLLEIRG